MPAQYGDMIKGTLLTYEVSKNPSRPDEYEYPYPTETDRKLFDAYASRRDQDDKIAFCGRLGEYRYYDMDKAIERAIEIAMKEINARS